MRRRSRTFLVAICLLTSLRGFAQSDDLALAREAYKKRDYAGAVKLLQPLVEQADAAAMTLMGRMRLAGQGAAKDESVAVDLFRKASDLGHAEAMFLLGRQMQTGNGLPKNEAQAVALFLKAAELGNADAQVWYGIGTYRGLGGLTQDKAASLEWFKRAAEQGNSLAQYWLGTFHDSGEVVEKNPYEAINWYRKAALQLDPAGQRSLGIAYARGSAVARDDAEAFKWLLSAAYLKDAIAQEWVGGFYEKGRFVLPDPVAAHMWYTLALARDPSRTNTRTALERVADKLTPAQLAEAQTKARQWPNATELAKAITATNALNAGGASASTAATTKNTGASNRSGSGFVIGASPSYIVTNHHVVKDCKSIRVAPVGLAATVRAKDERNDLALLNVPNLSAPPLKLRSGRSIRPGDDLITLGYPLAGLLAEGASVSTGTLTNLGGLNNDTSKFQISVPTQPGNSGGPVLDSYGQVVGVVVAQINAVGVSKATGSIPQNINFAVNTASLSSFLEASDVEYGSTQLQQDPKAKRLEASMVATLGRKSTFKVECLGN